MFLFAGFFHPKLQIQLYWSTSPACGGEYALCFSINIVDVKSYEKKMLYTATAIIATNSRGLPASFNYVVMAVGQDPGRTEAFRFSINVVAVKNYRRKIIACSVAWWSRIIGTGYATGLLIHGHEPRQRSYIISSAIFKSSLVVFQFLVVAPTFSFISKKLLVSLVLP